MRDPQDAPDCPEDKFKGYDNPLCKSCLFLKDCAIEAHEKGKCWDDCIHCKADRREHDSHHCRDEGIQHQCRYCQEDMITRVDCEG